MKAISDLIAATLIATSTHLCAEIVAEQKKPEFIEMSVDDTTYPMRSLLGYEATTVLPTEDEEGAMDTLIVKDKRIISRIENAVPVMFSPKGDILLLLDAAADDSVAYFLVDVTKIVDVPSFCERKKLSGRYIRTIRWSKDGESLELINQLGDESPAEILKFKVADNIVEEQVGIPNQNTQLAEIEKRVLDKQLKATENEITILTQNLQKATQPDQQADFRLNLEKQQLWLNELKARISSITPDK